MQVTTIFSFSRTRRDARTQKGLMCPIKYVKSVKGIVINHNPYPKIRRAKAESEKCSSMTLIR